MNAEITLKCDGTTVSGSVMFRGTTMDKLALCCAFLEEMHISRDEAMLIGMIYKGAGKTEGTETRINLSEYLKQKGEEDG